MDITLLRELFEMLVTIAETNGIDDPIVDGARQRLAEMPAGIIIGSTGQILEWSREFADDDPHHRHVSPLYGLYPGDGFRDPAQRAAAEVFLNRRGDDSSGWSLVWKMALWARLGRGDRVSELLRLFVRPAGSVVGQWAAGLYPNLFASHPPFQLDGNLGLVGAFAEALLQSHEGVVELLPALPGDLPDGEVTGLVARPGVIVGIRWQGGEIVSATLRARSERAAGRVAVRYRGVVIERDVTADTTTTLTADDFAGGSRR